MSGYSCRKVSEKQWKCRCCGATADVVRYACGKVEVCWINYKSACSSCDKAPKERDCRC
jgi:hypothetical protein